MAEKGVPCVEKHIRGAFFNRKNHIYNRRNVVQFLRKVSDSEQTKRAVLRKIRTALNVILSNCTRTRTVNHDLYGESILFICPNDDKLRCCPWIFS